MRNAPGWRRKGASRTGASALRRRASSGTISCAARAASIAPRSPIRSLIRADGTYLYTLPSVADDADLGVTHIIRGEDHVTNTAVQIQLFEILATNSVFGHHNLLTRLRRASQAF